jgi:hypothetical protein
MSISILLENWWERFYEHCMINRTLRSIPSLFLFAAVIFSTPLVIAAQLQPSFRLTYDEKNWEAVSSTKDSKIPPKETVDQVMAEKTLTVLQRKNSDDKYRARVSVVMDPLKKEEASLAAYQKHAVDFMKSQRFTILSQEPKKLPHISESAMEITANQRDFGLTFRQIIFVKGENAYLLTATTRTDKFASYEKEIEEILSSFHLDP